MVTKTYTLSELAALVAKDIGLDLNKKWKIHIDFYKDDDNYIFKITERNIKGDEHGN